MSILDNTFSTHERLMKARITLGKTKPFWAYLVMELKFKEVNPLICPTIGVDKYANCVYNKEFIDTLSDEQIVGVLCHEILHCAFEHMIRIKQRHPMVWNDACDSIINVIVQSEGFVLPPDGVSPEMVGIERSKLLKMTAEQVYRTIYDNYDKEKQNGNGSGNGQDGQDDNGSGSGFDRHIYSDKYADGKDSQISKQKQRQIKDGKYWKKKLVEAVTHGKLKGNLPVGMERRVDDLLDNSIDWKGVLYRFVTNSMPVDFTWQRPHKKSIVLKTYLPNIKKESLDVIIDIDTSGSISKKQLKEFLSEIVGIIRSFGNVSLTLISSDTKVYNPVTLHNPNIQDVLNYKPHGGGGTSHIPVFEWVKEHKPTAQLLICFTDGYTEFPNDSNINTLWVIQDGNNVDIPFGMLVTLPKDVE